MSKYLTHKCNCLCSLQWWIKHSLNLEKFNSNYLLNCKEDFLNKWHITYINEKDRPEEAENLKMLCFRKININENMNVL